MRILLPPTLLACLLALPAAASSRLPPTRMEGDRAGAAPRPCDDARPDASTTPALEGPAENRRQTMMRPPSLTHHRL